MTRAASKHAKHSLDRRASAAAWGRLALAVSARAVLYTIVGMMFWSAAPAALGWIPTTVVSGSMEPSIGVGDVVVAMPTSPDQLRKDRVVLIDDPDHPGRLRLHRIVGSTPDGMIVTKGDANAQADSTPVSPDAVRGVAVLRTPLIGMPVVWIRDGEWGLVLAASVAVGLLVLASRTDRRGRDPQAPVEGTGDRPHGEGRPRTGRFGHPRAGTLGPASALSAMTLLGVALLSAGGSSAAYAGITANAGSSLASRDYRCLDRAPAYTPFLYYAFNEADGVVAEDSSANGRPGALLPGATRSTGSCLTNASPVLNLDGASGQVVTLTQQSAPNVFTVETWFRTTTTRGGKLIGFGNSRSGLSTQFDRHLYMTDAGRITFGVYNGAVTTVVSPKSYNDGAWHLATATLSSRGLVLYVDGVSVATSTASTTGEATTGYWRIGYDNLSGWPSAPTSPYFTGSLDNTAVYGTALTSAQVASNFTRNR